MEHYIYNVPVFITHEPASSIDISAFCSDCQEILPSALLKNIDVVYIGNFKELHDKNAAYLNGGIYMSAAEPTVFDMVENFVHEVAHSLEDQFAWQIYDDELIREFKGKRERLRHLLNAEGFEINPVLYSYTEYNQKFDNFLANEVGYPTLLSLTIGLFVSPYGATSIQEYFANGFEKYFLDNSRTVEKISPILYGKIEQILNEQA